MMWPHSTYCDGCEQTTQRRMLHAAVGLNASLGTIMDLALPGSMLAMFKAHGGASSHISGDLADSSSGSL